MNASPSHLSPSSTNPPSSPNVSASSLSAPPVVIPLITSIAKVKGVGPSRAAALRRLGIVNVGYLLAHLPLRHERLEPESDIASLAPDALVATRGLITATRLAGNPNSRGGRRGPEGGRGGRGVRFEAALMDDTGRLDLVWFNGDYLRDRLHPGMRIRVQGKAQRFGRGLQLVNPKFEVLPDVAAAPTRPDAGAREGRLRPVYPSTEGITSEHIEAILSQVLVGALLDLQDHLDPPFLSERSMPTLQEAYSLMHAPRDEDSVAHARRRLAYDELLMLQLAVHMKRSHLRSTLRAVPLRHNAAIDKHIRARFPFSLTASQNSVLRDITQDLTRAIPTNRLIQGDVGSGKTVVALYAMLLAAASRKQAALMAPTELLAEQHAASIGAMLDKSDVRVELLTGSMPTARRREILAEVERGGVDILIGTHAIIGERVRFADLAVAVIDEQHRFGVQQRAALREKGAIDSTAPAGATPSGLTPHVLVMTATPIPRTIAMTIFGDLDVSTIRSLPPGRAPVVTRIVAPDRSQDVYEFVRERIDAGDQAFVIAPAIDSPSSQGLLETEYERSGESTGTRTAHAGGLTDIHTLKDRLETGPLHGRRLGLLHGRLNAAAREQVMNRFRAGEIQVLVATTVVEVGVDVPNATVMVVEHAERFGLSQLHQLRGRVGRGHKRGICILIGDATTPDAGSRLESMRELSDGFRLAERDLEIRGPGELFGTRQAGLPPFRVANLIEDRELLALAARDADAIVRQSPTLEGENQANLRRRVLRMYGTWLGLGDVG